MVSFSGHALETPCAISEEVEVDACSLGYSRSRATENNSVGISHSVLENSSFRFVTKILVNGQTRLELQDYKLVIFVPDAGKLTKYSVNLSVEDTLSIRDQLLKIVAENSSAMEGPRNQTLSPEEADDLSEFYRGFTTTEYLENLEPLE